MNRPVIRSIWRFIILVLIQVLILSRINLGGSEFNYIQIFVYPLFLLLLPISIARGWLLVLGFLIGLTVDMFYNSPGMHAGAAVFSAFIRPNMLSALEPRGGYKINSVPNIRQFGSNWFFRYASAVLSLHVFFYFLLEAFDLSQILQILLKSVLSFVASLGMIGIYMLIFNPKD